MKTKIQEKFKAMFGDGASLFASPGRVNLIGEHTDYNLGFVLPGAIDKAIYVALKPNDGTVCRVYSLDYDETVELDLHGEKPSQQWACYVYGVCQEMEKRGALILPFDMAFGGDVPLGAGLSSSAALESAVGFALNETYGLGFDREQLAKIGQMTEHNYVGVRCGIMDQFASLFGEAGHVIRLDCRSLEYKLEPFDPQGCRVVLFDTQVKHTLASSEYNVRRAQCEAGVAVVLRHVGGVESLRDVTADMLDERPSMALEACTVRPVWITVDVPQDAAPGLYRTPVTVACDGDEQRLELAVEVTGRTLPAPSEWRYHLDLWQHPAAVARVEGTEMWSDAHFEALRPVMKPLADAGQKVVTATLNKDPWNNQCYDAYADMIVWTKGADGAWTYDYAAFDRWVEFMEGLGVDKQINCYSMLPWNNMLHYRDAATGEWVDVKAEPGQPAFDEMWRPFLADFVRHLEEKGWLAKTCIAMDERSPEQMEIAVAFLAEHAPQLGIALADNHDSYKRYPQLHDICVSARQEVAPEDIAARRAAGQVTTYYVCCSHRYPNMFTFSDPAEATVAAWYAVANGYDGFLRWAYNSWTEDPLRDSRFRTWPAGDTYVVYPGGRSSIRFERLREGIQDAEKIRILRAEPGRGNSAGSDEKRARLEAVIAPFASREPAADLHERLAEAKRVLNEL